jgi:hypothetical protein
MRTTDPSSLASRITARIVRGGGDRLWTYRDFADLDAPATAIATTLSRLARKRMLQRIRRGVYYRPDTTVLGETQPDPHAALDATLRRNRVRGVSTDLEAWRRLGLTTQVTAVPTIATPRRHRLASVAGHPVRTRVRGTTPAGLHNERAVLDALRSLRRIPGATPAEVLHRILLLIKGGKLDAAALAKMARREPPRVRALVGALLEEAGADAVPPSLLGELRRSLNPATRYRMPEAAAWLKSAASWGIW